MAQIRIHLLGGFLLERSGSSLPPIPSAVGRSLFAYLVTYRDLRHTRDLLAGTFWPDHPETSARRRLSQALWQIQTALQEAGLSRNLVQGTTSDVAFSANARDFWLDVSAFDAHLAAAAEAETEQAEIGELQSGVALYRGDFMAGFYDDWTIVERERLRGRYLGALNQLVAAHKSRADYETALSFARQLALHDPLREGAHREIMRLCFLLGRANEALHQYERCVGILNVELGAEPAAETQELYAQILQLRDKGERAFAPTIRAPLLDVEKSIAMVGRDDERVAVLRKLEETLQGRGGAVLIEGDSGIGKTRLVEELTEDAQWRGLSPMRAECREETQLHPYEALRTALTSGLSRLRVQQLAAALPTAAVADLARLVPEVGEWLPVDAPHRSAAHALGKERLRYSLRQALVALGELSPHVLFVDDAQWADEESIGVLADLGPELRSHGLLICLAYRGAETRARTALWESMVAIDSAAATERVELRSLALAEATQLIEESLGTASVLPHVAEGLFHETGGNPLFLLETLRAWHQDSAGTLEQDDLASADIEFPVSGGVAQVIARRLAALEPAAEAVLESMAVIGKIEDSTMLAAVADLTGIEALQGLERLISRGAVIEANGDYDFAHHQIKRVALDSVTPERRRALHHTAASFLESHYPTRVEELAFHFAEADESAKAYSYSLASGQRAASLGAFETAVQHYEKAAAHRVGAQDPFELYTVWETALGVLGRRTEQRKVLDVLGAAVMSATGAAEVASRRARLLALEGDHAAALTLAEQAVADMAEGGSESDQGRMLQTLGTVLRLSGRIVEAIQPLETAVASFGGDPVQESAARLDLGTVLCEAQRYGEAIDHFQVALRRFEQLGDVFGLAAAYGELAVARMEQGEGELAVELYRKALDHHKESGYRRGEAVNLANLGNVLYHQGHIAEALRQYDGAAEVFAAIGDRTTGAIVSLNAASVRHTVMGDDTVEPSILGALDFFESEAHQWGQAFAHEHLAAIAHKRGYHDIARQHIAVGLELVTGTGHRWVEVHLLRLAAEIELETGSLDEAERLANDALALCEELGLSDVTPTVTSIVGMVQLQRGNTGDALSTLEHAAGSLESGSERPYVVWYRFFRAADRAGRSKQARKALTRAVRLLDEVIGGLEPLQREMARLVPEHRAILGARERMFTLAQPVLLPKLDVPLGRPLRDDDWVEVHWTLTDPSDFAISSVPVRRRFRLLRLLKEAEEQGGAPRIEDLADAIDVSVATVRRDLATLRDEGHRIVTRGGR